MGLESRRLGDVRRVFEPFVDRRHLVRLDRNEDPDGWDQAHFSEWLATLSPHDLAAYSDTTELVERIARWQSLSFEQIVVTAGSDAAIKLIFETYLDPGDRVLVLDPSWRMYEVWASVYQAQLESVPFSSELTIDVEEIVGAIDRKHPRLVVIANPNQPTGSVLNLEELESIVNAADRAGALTIIDEAYHLFSKTTALDLLASHPQTIVVRTFSKAFGLAGLRVGYCMGSADRVRELRLLRPVTDASSLAIHAAVFSLDNIDWVSQRVSNVIEGRDFLTNQLSERRLAFFPSVANFILIACKSDDAARECVASCCASGYVIKGPMKVGSLESIVRVSIGSLETMERFWWRCGLILESHALLVSR